MLLLFQAVGKDKGVGNVNVDIVHVSWEGLVQWFPGATYS